MDQSPSTPGATGERHPLLSLISACFWVIREFFIPADRARCAGLKDRVRSVSLVVEMVQVTRRLRHYIDTPLDLLSPLIFDDPDREPCSEQIRHSYLTIIRSSTFGLSQ